MNHQVEQLNEHRNERNNRVKLAEDDRNKLAGGFEEAKKWLILKNTQTKNKNEVYQATIFYKVIFTFEYSPIGFYYSEECFY